MKYHPEFDCATRTWFIAGTDYEAKSLRELKDSIPGHVFLIGWFPDGFKGRLRDPIGKHPARRPLSTVAKMLQPKQSRSLYPLSSRPRERPKPIKLAGALPPVICETMHTRWTTERDALLVKLWGDGYSSDRIAVTMKVSRNAIVGRIHRLRQIGVALEFRREKAA